MPDTLFLVSRQQRGAMQREFAPPVVIDAPGAVRLGFG